MSDHPNNQIYNEALLCSMDFLAIQMSLQGQVLVLRCWYITSISKEFRKVGMR